jgi:amino acid transporter
VIIFNGWEVFTTGYWDASNFVVAYINIPIFAILVGAYYFVKRPRWIRAEDLDFVSNIPTDEEVHYEEPAPRNIFVKFMNLLLT